MQAGPFSVRLRVERLDSQHRTVLRVEPAAPDRLASLRLIGFLGAYAHRLGVCPEAHGRWFVGMRKGQTFCSRTCQSRAAVRAFRTREPKTASR